LYPYIIQEVSPNTERGVMTMNVCKCRRSLGGTALVVLIGSLWAVPVQAADYDVGPIHIAQPWARATSKGAKSGAAYMTVTNKGATPDRLSCVSSDASAECQLHSMTMENGVMKMRPVEGGLEIKAGEAVTLKPSSTHLMLLNLKHPLEQDSAITATLLFEKAGTVQVEFPIAAIGAAAPGAAAGDTMMHGSGRAGTRLSPWTGPPSPYNRSHSRRSKRS
jgi:copper(I)-binding protein